MHSTKAISSARATMASAILCRMFAPLLAADVAPVVRNAFIAAFAARSISAAPPRATLAITALSTGEAVSKVSPPPASGLPSIRCGTVAVAEAGEKPSARAIAWSRACSRRLLRLAADGVAAEGELRDLVDLDGERERMRRIGAVEPLVGGRPAAIRRASAARPWRGLRASAPRYARRRCSGCRRRR